MLVTKNISCTQFSSGSKKQMTKKTKKKQEHLIQWLHIEETSLFNESYPSWWSRKETVQTLNMSFLCMKFMMKMSP